MPEITKSEGYQSLLAAVEKDEGSRDWRCYREKLEWVVARVAHYAELTGVDPCALLDRWEKERDYWYMNYYQEANQPRLDGTRVRVFDTTRELQDAIGDSAFRCPMCGGVSTDPYACNSGKEMEPGKVCDWKVYGLFRDMGKGVFVFVRSELRGQLIFTPMTWEQG